jgi:hypothetical protein
MRDWGITTPFTTTRPEPVEAVDAAAAFFEAPFLPSSCASAVTASVPRATATARLMRLRCMAIPLY